MYIGVDVGGTKTLLAVLDAHGVIKESRKFPTPKNYRHFLLELRHSAAFITTKELQAGAAGIPATSLDRKHGIGISFGNLPWQNVPIQADLERLFHCPIVVENDAKLAALSEAMLLKNEYKRVLYVTISTGIGIGLVVNGKLDIEIGDGGGRLMMVEHKGKLVPWEGFASGHAIVELYGKPARDITDNKTWLAIARNLSVGLLELIALAEPEVIVFGGSVGTYFDRFGDLLAKELKKFETPLLPMPALRAAARPEEAVIYGCYDIAKATYGKTA